MNKNYNVLACDPGTGGGFAWFKKPGTIGAQPMPQTFNELKVFMSCFQDCILFIESQAVRGGEDPAHIRGLNILLENYHEIKTLAKVNGMTIKYVGAKWWQKKFSPVPRDYQKRKVYLRKIAVEKYARLKPTGKTADAILILEHALTVEL